MKQAKLTPYQRLLRAGRADRGLVLSAYEVMLLMRDDAITRRAELDDLESSHKESKP